MRAAEWNSKYGVGTRVRYFPIMHQREFENVLTRSEAWDLGHGQGVVKITGRTGGVCLEHLIPLPGKGTCMDGVEEIDGMDGKRRSGRQLVFLPMILTGCFCGIVGGLVDLAALALIWANEGPRDMAPYALRMFFAGGCVCATGIVFVVVGRELFERARYDAGGAGCCGGGKVKGAG